MLTMLVMTFLDLVAPKGAVFGWFLVEPFYVVPRRTVLWSCGSVEIGARLQQFSCTTGSSVKFILACVAGGMRERARPPYFRGRSPRGIFERRSREWNSQLDSESLSSWSSGKDTVRARTRGSPRLTYHQSSSRHSKLQTLTQYALKKPERELVSYLREEWKFLFSTKNQSRFDMT